MIGGARCPAFRSPSKTSCRLRMSTWSWASTQTPPRPPSTQLVGQRLRPGDIRHVVRRLGRPGALRPCRRRPKDAGRHSGACAQSNKKVCLHGRSVPVFAAHCGNARADGTASCPRYGGHRNTCRGFRRSTPARRRQGAAFWPDCASINFLATSRAISSVSAIVWPCATNP